MKTENLAGILSLVCGTLAVPAFPNPSGAIGQYVGTWIATVVVLFIIFWGIGKVMGGWDAEEMP